MSEANAPSAASAFPKPESRWPAAIAIALAVPLQVMLPDEVTPPLAWVFLGLAVFLMVIIVIFNPRRLDAEARNLRRLSLLVIILLAAANLISLVTLLQGILAKEPSQVSGRALIIAAAAIWATGVIVYGLLYWELDGGGPQARTINNPEPGACDFLFPQQQPDLEKVVWHSRLIDYLYLALTNAMAFGPTDTMPLTRRAKTLMGTQSIMSLATIAVVGARAVGILS